jgi:hypothetical protein
MLWIRYVRLDVIWGKPFETRSSMVELGVTMLQDPMG